MADFKTAYKLVLDYEGEYSNDANDRGGETYCGIARNFFPKWRGWKYVDNAKSKYGTKPSVLSKNLKGIADLQEAVSEWYKEEWWDKLKLDNLSQTLANEMFEQSINLGKGGHGKLLQMLINAFNYDPKTNKAIFTDLVVDGAVGPKTLNALATILARRTDEKTFAHALNCLQGYHYINLSANKVSQRAFLRGWLTRTYDEK